jgi:3-methyladenine DNA glycosylase AlkD
MKNIQAAALLTFLAAQKELRKCANPLRYAERLLEDDEDLIHKASGWMLREVGKKDEKVLTAFLKRYGAVMPRTMLRYAIEKFSAPQRKRYLEMRARVMSSAGTSITGVTRFSSPKR